VLIELVEGFDEPEGEKKGGKSNVCDGEGGQQM